MQKESISLQALYSLRNVSSLGRFKNEPSAITGLSSLYKYSFSVPNNFPLPPSLQNMYKELENEYGVPVHRTGDLTDWAKQGVLLMNTILTVEEHKPLSHQNMGWQNFTNEALRWINEKDGPVVFLLWGSKAIQSKKLLTNPKHLILTSPHPSPLSAYRGFFGNNHFKLANEYLVKNNETPIQWI